MGNAKSTLPRHPSPWAPAALTDPPASGCQRRCCWRRLRAALIHQQQHRRKFLDRRFDRRARSLFLGCPAAIARRVVQNSWRERWPPDGLRSKKDGRRTAREATEMAAAQLVKQDKWLPDSLCK